MLSSHIPSKQRHLSRFDFSFGECMCHGHSHCIGNGSSSLEIGLLQQNIPAASSCNPAILAKCRLAFTHFYGRRVTRSIKACLAFIAGAFCIQPYLGMLGAHSHIASKASLMTGIPWNMRVPVAIPKELVRLL